MRSVTSVRWAAVCGVAILSLAGATGSTRAARAGGTIVGVVTTKEPPGPAIRVTIDQAACGASLPDEAIVVDAAGHLANAVITIAGLKGAPPAETTISNTGCRFVPRVSMLRPGGSVKMTSTDPVLHTMRASTADGRALFNISLPVPNMAVWRALDAAGPVQFACSTHPWMRGYVVVSADAAIVTGADGAFRVENVPPGTYDVQFWHESLHASSARVTVKDGATATVNLVAVK